MKDCMMMQARIDKVFLTASDAAHIRRHEHVEPVRAEEAKESATAERPSLQRVHHRR